MSEQSPTLALPDVMGFVVISAQLIAHVVIVPLLVVPGLSTLLEDFGGPLPLVTKLLLWPGTSPIMAIVPGALFAYVVIRIEDLEPRRVRSLLLACFVLLLCCHALVLVSAYLPVFQLSSALAE